MTPFRLEGGDRDLRVLRPVLPGVSGRVQASRAEPHQPDLERSEDGVDEDPSVATLPAPMWVAAVHLLFIGWTVVNAHHPPLFIGGFLFFLGFARRRAPTRARSTSSRRCSSGSSWRDS